MKKHKLQRSVLFGFAGYALLLILCIGTVVVAQHIRTKTSDSHAAAFAYTKAAAEYIDGDHLEKYIEGGEKDEYYMEMQRYFTINVENSNLLDFYVGVPREDGILFLWDVAKIWKSFGLGELMSYEEYGEGTQEFLSDILSKNPPEELITGYEEGVFIATACSPIYNSAGEPVAIVAADLSYPNVKSEIGHALLMVILVIVGLVLASAFIFFILVRKKVILPIQKLNDASKDLVAHLQNNETPDIKIKTGNEIEELSDSFLQMYEEVREYIEKLNNVTAEKERIGAELNVAAKIQASMLPCIFPAFPDSDEFDIYASMSPAKEVGGDFYDFFMVDEEHLAVVVADVSGKGVPAALFMVIGKTLIKDHTQFHADLGDVFTEVNDILCDSNSQEMFITAFEGVLNIHTGEFRYVNAGHETPFICRSGGVFEPFKLKAGLVLAGMAGMKYQSGSLMLHPGDMLFQYTDGVTESTNDRRKLYGMNRLERVLVKNSRKTPRELLEAVKEELDIFAGQAPQFDDITMLCLKYKGGKDHEGTDS